MPGIFLLAGCIRKRGEDYNRDSRELHKEARRQPQGCCGTATGAQWNSHRVQRDSHKWHRRTVIMVAERHPRRGRILKRDNHRGAKRQPQWSRDTVTGLHRKKKVREFPVPSRDVTTKLSLGGNNDVITELFLPRGSLVSDIPAGDGKLVNLFLRCAVGQAQGHRETAARG